MYFSCAGVTDVYDDVTYVYDDVTYVRAVSVLRFSLGVGLGFRV